MRGWLPRIRGLPFSSLSAGWLRNPTAALGEATRAKVIFHAVCRTALRAYFRFHLGGFHADLSGFGCFRLSGFHVWHTGREKRWCEKKNPLTLSGHEFLKEITRGLPIVFSLELFHALLD